MTEAVFQSFIKVDNRVLGAERLESERRLPRNPIQGGNSRDFMTEVLEVSESLMWSFEVLKS